MVHIGEWRPLGPQKQPKMKAHDILCFHTMVGSLAGTDAMFKANGYGGTESHNGLGYDGTLYQWQDYAYSADANLDGWYNVVSVETADTGTGFPKWSGSDVPPWNTAQLKVLIDLGYRHALPGTNALSAHKDCPKTWACYKSGIPASLIPDTKPSRRGFGFHAQGVEGMGLVSGGIKWSLSKGKVCPGANRISQLKTVIIPGVQAKLKGIDVATLDAEDKAWLVDTLVPKIYTYDGIPAPAPWNLTNPTWTPSQYMQNNTKYVLQILTIVSNPQSLADAISAKMPPGQAVDKSVIEAALKDVLGSLDN